MNLIPYGMTPQRYGAVRQWATRRDRYGVTGVTAQERETRAANMRRIRTNGHHQKRKTHCPQGHPYAGPNLILERGARKCRECVNARRRGRPSWLVVDGVRVSLVAHDRFVQGQYRRLRAALIAAHPDKGGSSARFRKAKRALDRFLEAERPWYQRAGIAMPVAA